MTNLSKDRLACRTCNATIAWARRGTSWIMVDIFAVRTGLRYHVRSRRKGPPVLGKRVTRWLQRGHRLHIKHKERNRWN